MAKESTHISRILQDTFDELQAELARQRKELETGSVDAPDIDIEDIVTELARTAGFEVVKLIGAGGMGAVVKATDIKLKRTVALKFLPPEVLSNVEDAKELRREAEIASCIQHENVVQIFSWHEVDNVPFYVMEYIDGENVEDLVRRRGKLPSIEALRITAEAARGLEALHAAGIIHRDIKPQNILISQDGRVKITDFGISRTQESITYEVNRSKMIAGTPKFMAPEQARGEAATKHSDIYSLGATLYYLLTGRAPVEAAPDLRKQIEYVKEGRILPITNFLPKLNRDIARLVMRAISPIQSKRSWDVAIFRKDIDQVFLSLTVRDRPFLVQVMVRHRRVIIAIVAFLIGTIFGFFAGYQLSSIRYQRSEGPPGQLMALAGREVARLDEILAADPGAADVSTIRNQLQDAMRGNSTQVLADRVFTSTRVTNRWQILLSIRREANDPNSPLRSEAIHLLGVLETGSSTEIQEATNQWRRIWLESLNGNSSEE